jgi:choline dehydrogenase-like flavoprotein
MKTYHADILVIGTGMGGGIISRALAESGRQVLIVERGQRLPIEPENWDATEVFLKNRYKNAGNWVDAQNSKFSPGVHYYVGGNTKVYGASLIRFREFDFEEFRMPDGVSPAWPFTYRELEPYYAKAEKYLRVRGRKGDDLFDPYRSDDYAYRALEHDPYMENFSNSLKKQGLHPYHASMGVDFGDGGNCIRCITCDGYPCKLGAKNDAETCGVNPALATGNANLLTGCDITKLLHDESGKAVIAATGFHNGEPIEIKAKYFVLSGGAANSAQLLLKSKSDFYPNGLANSSGQVGKNWMVHNATFTVGFNPFRRNTTQFQKTLSFNDWYQDSVGGYPLGNVQMLGRLNWQIFKAVKPFIPKFILKWFANHTIDLYLESEDLPDDFNRVELSEEGGIRIFWKQNNMKVHKNLIKRTKKALHKAGYPIVITQTMGIETNSHQCGTVVAGKDPKTSVLNEYCKAHEMDNLYVVDSSFFPSSAAANPALTIAAQAIRVAEKGGINP